VSAAIALESLPTADALATRCTHVRRRSVDLVEGLSGEDLSAQSMPDASPGKWHLAHTTWFFEAMVLGPHANQRPYREGWHFLFNSYYDAFGERHPRPLRGLLTRPSLEEIRDWRADVDQRLAALLATNPDAPTLRLIELGTHHEQQHQELLVTDLKHLFSLNPLAPSWRGAPPALAHEPVPPLRWIEFAEAGTVAVGHDGHGFAFDNEGPRHRVWLAPFAIADRPASNGEYLDFIADGGYEDPRLWLSDGWAAVQAARWNAPLYWQRRDDGWQQFTVYGWRDIDPAEPVAHLSFYEADAYARWAGARLPTEVEWEHAATPRMNGRAFADDGRLHPSPLTASSFGGNVWEWTASAYSGYPGYRPPPGAVGEYNGKFMSGQMVLRGGSCATPRDHVRASYRNFFPPAARWQFSGLRLARDT
jgi:ergothioneine biosynthesis protein EgtB